MQFDACFAGTHAGYGIRITNGLVPTSGGNWGAACKFEGDQPYAPGGAAGTISYQELTTGTNAYVPTSPSVAYQAAAWYTVRDRGQLDSKTYRIYIGPRGGALACVTPTTGVSLIKSSTGAQISYAGGLTSSHPRKPSLTTISTSTTYLSHPTR